MGAKEDRPEPDFDGAISRPAAERSSASATLRLALQSLAADLYRRLLKRERIPEGTNMSCTVEVGEEALDVTVRPRSRRRRYEAEEDRPDPALVAALVKAALTPMRREVVKLLASQSRGKGLEGRAVAVALEKVFGGQPPCVRTDRGITRPSNELSIALADLTDSGLIGKDKDKEYRLNETGAMVWQAFSQGGEGDASD